MPKPTPILKPILISEPILIPEPISIPEPIMIPVPIQELIPETDSGLNIRNRFRKTSELSGIDSEENFIFPITSLYICSLVSAMQSPYRQRSAWFQFNADLNT